MCLWRFAVLIGDIDASGDGVPYLLFGVGSFTVAPPNPGMRITASDLLQSNGRSIIIAPGGGQNHGFDTLIYQNNVKSDGTPQSTRNVINELLNYENGAPLTVPIEMTTI